jgi:hypothetical protein
MFLREILASGYVSSQQARTIPTENIEGKISYLQMCFFCSENLYIIEHYDDQIWAWKVAC